MNILFNFLLKKKRKKENEEEKQFPLLSTPSLVSLAAVFSVRPSHWMV
jgi:hypothetical protein